ncbi:MAG: VOC family protein [Candidatus Eremiobacteraeota bacterium]|nr:VOC family protein [Candidatus Eremiobacteraeota bacterium]MBC5804134.1 VOC family protein [Candidatus Eremiobacteraeota bacterium]MBC5821813.1 VOC family protein [Candidatus Eremiobacteraeota bacterium]
MEQSTEQTPVTNPPAGWPRIAPHLIYEDPARAIGWLTRAFGFAERTSARHTSPGGTVERAQMTVDDSILTLGLPSIHGQSPKEGVSTMLKIYVDDVDAHYQRARAAGATIVLELADRPWGDRVYQASDPEGHQWSFAQHIFDVAPDVYLVGCTNDNKCL